MTRSKKNWYNEYPFIVANYRFVALNEEVLPWDLLGAAVDNAPSPPSLCDPVSGGLSGQLTIEWLTATSFLIGQDIDGVQHPMRLKKGDPNSPFIIPPTTLRGMIRSVLRIATWSKLGPTEDVFASFREPNYQGAKYSAGDPQSGWLILEGETWVLKTCKSSLVINEPTEIDVSGLSTDSRKDISKIHKKVAAKIKKCQNQLLKIDDKIVSGSDANGKSIVQAHLVFSGLYSDKNNKYLFSLPSDGSIHLTAECVRNFFEAYSMYRKKAKRAGSNLAAWLDEYVDRNDISPEVMFRATNGITVDRNVKCIRDWDNPPGIPVWFLGNVNNPETIGLGMSQIMRVSSKFSTHQVIERTQKQAFSQSLLDWSEAIFGYVHEPNGSETSDELRGRVDIGYSKAAATLMQIPVKGKTFHVVQMQPRSGYFPNYLHHNEEWNRADKLFGMWEDFGYDSENSLINGRKRYPLLKYDGLRSMTPKNMGKSNESESELRFLQNGAVFSGPVSFHNLHPLELGALLWAITFGDEGAFANEGGKYHHSAGRLKSSLWCGQLKPRNLQIHRLVTNPEIQISRLDTGDVKSGERVVETSNTDDGKNNLDAKAKEYIVRFKQYMGRKMMRLSAPSAECPELIGASEENLKVFVKAFDNSMWALLDCAEPQEQRDGIKVGSNGGAGKIFGNYKGARTSLTTDVDRRIHDVERSLQMPFKPK